MADAIVAVATALAVVTMTTACENLPAHTRPPRAANAARGLTNAETTVATS